MFYSNFVWSVIIALWISFGTVIFWANIKLNRIFVEEIIVGGFISYILFYIYFDNNKLLIIIFFILTSSRRNWISFSKWLKKFSWLSILHLACLLKVSQFFSLMNLSIPQTFDELFNELFKNLLTTGVSSCTSSYSESHFFKLLLDPVMRSSSCSTISSNKLVISFKLSVKSYFSFPSLRSAIVALSRVC